MLQQQAQLEAQQQQAAAQAAAAAVRWRRGAPPPLAEPWGAATAGGHVKLVASIPVAKAKSSASFAEAADWCGQHCDCLGCTALTTNF